MSRPIGSRLSRVALLLVQSLSTSSSTTVASNIYSSLLGTLYFAPLREASLGIRITNRIVIYGPQKVDRLTSKNYGDRRNQKSQGRNGWWRARRRNRRDSPDRDASRRQVRDRWRSFFP